MQIALHNYNYSACMSLLEHWGQLLYTIFDDICRRQLMKNHSGYVPAIPILLIIVACLVFNHLLSVQAIAYMDMYVLMCESCKFTMYTCTCMFETSRWFIFGYHSLCSQKPCTFDQVHAVLLQKKIEKRKPLLVTMLHIHWLIETESGEC